MADKKTPAHDPKIGRVTDVSSFLRIVGDLQKEQERRSGFGRDFLGQLWYRGVSQQFPSQVPGVYRPAFTERAKRLSSHRRCARNNAPGWFALKTATTPTMSFPMPRKCSRVAETFMCGRPSEPHGTGFLRGRVSAVRKAEVGDGERWIIAIGEFARINIPDAWKHWRNPVRYMSLPELGINLEEITFQPTPESDEQPPSELPAPAVTPGAMLTIAEAKRQLAVVFGVKPEAVEITIRG